MDFDERLERIKQRQDALLLRLQREAEKRREEERRRRMGQLDATLDRLERRIQELEGRAS